MELTQNPIKWNIEWVNLDIRACNTLLVWAADKHSHSIITNMWLIKLIKVLIVLPEPGFNGFQLSMGTFEDAKKNWILLCRIIPNATHLM